MARPSDGIHAAAAAVDTRLIKFVQEGNLDSVKKWVIDRDKILDMLELTRSTIPSNQRELNINAVGRDGKTAYEIAQNNENEALMKVLKAAGACASKDDEISPATSPSAHAASAARGGGSGPSRRSSY